MAAGRRAWTGQPDPSSITCSHSAGSGDPSNRDGDVTGSRSCVRQFMRAGASRRSGEWAVGGDGVLAEAGWWFGSAVRGPTGPSCSRTRALSRDPDAQRPLRSAPVSINGAEEIFPPA